MVMSERIKIRTRKGLLLEKEGLSGKEIAKEFGITKTRWGISKMEFLKEEGESEGDFPFKKLLKATMTLLGAGVAIDKEDEIYEWLNNKVDIILSNQGLIVNLSAGVITVKKILLPLFDMLSEKDRQTFRDLLPLLSGPIGWVGVLFIIWVVIKPYIMVLLEQLDPDRWAEKTEQVTGQKIQEQQTTEQAKDIQEGRFWEAVFGLSTPNILAGAGGR